MRPSIGALSLLGMVGVYVLASGCHSPKPDRAENRETAPSAPSHPLADVDKVRAAVRPILPATNWEIIPGLPGFYGYSEFIYPDIAVQSSLEYHITGPARNEVREVLFEGFIASPERLASVRQIMKSAAETWSQSLGVALPEGLIDAIRKGKDLESVSGGLSFSFKVERGNEIRQLAGGSYRATFMYLKVTVA